MGNGNFLQMLHNSGVNAFRKDHPIFNQFPHMGTSAFDVPESVKTIAHGLNTLSVVAGIVNRPLICLRNEMILEGAKKSFAKNPHLWNTTIDFLQSSGIDTARPFSFNGAQFEINSGKVRIL